MKPIVQTAAAFALLALGACSSGLDTEASLVGMAPAAALAAGVPQFASTSAALPVILAQGSAKKVTYVSRAERPIIGGNIAADCPYR